LAPEIVAGTGHGKGVDWWTLGIFLFETLASYPPFYDEEPMQTYSKIMKGAVSFPSHFSREGVALIEGLLQHKTTQRLGVVKGGAENIKNNPWFKGFDFNALYNRKLSPPLVPKIKNDTDLSNFDDYPDEEDPIPSYEDDGSNWDADF
jgi:serine/threonine protein kinase